MKKVSLLLTFGCSLSTPHHANALTPCRDGQLVYKEKEQTIIKKYPASLNGSEGCVEDFPGAMNKFEEIERLEKEKKDCLAKIRTYCLSLKKGKKKCLIKGKKTCEDIFIYEDIPPEPQTNPEQSPT